MPQVPGTSGRGSSQPVQRRRPPVYLRFPHLAPHPFGVEAVLNKRSNRGPICLGNIRNYAILEIGSHKLVTILYLGARSFYLAPKRR